jgi:hypothetical protein
MADPAIVMPKGVWAPTPEAALVRAGEMDTDLGKEADRAAVCIRWVEEWRLQS